MIIDFEFFLTAATLLCALLMLAEKLLSHIRRQNNNSRAIGLAFSYARSFFPIFLVVLLIRSFLVEPYRIPSGSMMPTLLKGDFILVNKFAYGLRFPVLRTLLGNGPLPEYGDIIVFRYPPDRSLAYIKRVVGLPGDEIIYQDKTLHINGEPVVRSYIEAFHISGNGRKMNGAKQFMENLKGAEHAALHWPIASQHGISDEQLPTRYIVPADHYFVMGDNRDNSADSRVWGFVPRENLTGKAFFIWLNFDWGEKAIHFSRLGTIK